MIDWHPRPSLELNWLTRHFKQLPLPMVGFIREAWFGGCYLWPDDQPCFTAGLYIPPTPNGALLINITSACDYFKQQSIIAHEFRHHWQQHNGWQLGDTTFDTEADYDIEITRFFTAYPSETDALRFEYQYAPCPHNEWLIKKRLSIF